MTAVVVDLVSWALLLAGGFVVAAGGIGLIRLPDVYTRLHAAGTTDTLGSALVIAGLMLQAGWSLVAVKLALILLFFMLTSPVSSHALAKAALAGGVAPRVGKPPDG
jgi:multicomponent Na+:H+ antiporter subunit G